MLRLRPQVPVDRGLDLVQVLDHILQVVCATQVTCRRQQARNNTQTIDCVLVLCRWEKLTVNRAQRYRRHLRWLVDIFPQLFRPFMGFGERGCKVDLKYAERSRSSQ